MPKISNDNPGMTDRKADDVSLAYLLLVLIRRRKALIWPAILSLAFGIGLALIMPRKYTV